MPLEFTGLIIGNKNAALIIAPQSAYVLAAQCTFGCGPAFYVADNYWTASVDLATIFRTEDAGGRALTQAKRHLFGCLLEKGTTFDIKPLAGFVEH